VPSLLFRMSESAALVKPFFQSPLRKPAFPGTLQTDGAEDKALPGGNLSADSVAKTRLGSGVELGPSNKILNWDWHQSDKSQGSGDGVPRKNLSFYCRLVSSVPLSA